MKKLLLISLTMLISLISKASDYSVDGIGYIIKSVENKTVYVDKITFSGDIVIPDKVQINNYWFTVDSIGNIDNSPESSSLKINGVIKTNGRSLYGYRTACFYVDESNPYMKAEDGILYSKDMKRLISFPSRKRISEFTIPESVSAIDDYSFGDNKYLTRLIFNDNIEDLPENFIYGSDFSGKLKYLKLSDKIKVIHGRCLNYYPTLEEIVLPKDLEEVEKDPHYDYYGLPNELETVTISNSKIANYSYKLEPSTFVFSRFSKLKNLHVDDPNPVALDNNVFTEGKYFTINVYVPAGTKEIYQNTDGWKNFFNIIEESAPQYKLSYIVDGKEYKTYMLDSGVTITPEPAPIKEGYTFSGWSEIPETMPANDVTITGSFSVNSYKLTYMVDNVEYKSFMIEYGAAITPEEAPEKEGYTFSGWSEIPETMPDYDVVVTGTFTQNKLEKCETPSISYDNGQLKMGCATEGVTFITEVKVADAKQYFDETIQLSCIYDISVYATKAGYDNSETVTATLCWIDAEPKTEGISNGVTEVRARAALIKSNGDQFTVEGIDDGQTVEIYSLNGEKRGSAVSKNGVACIDTNVHPGSVVVVKIGNKSVKVIVK